jgi:Protein of unknown function (DUF2975)
MAVTLQPFTRLVRFLWAVATVGAASAALSVGLGSLEGLLCVPSASAGDRFRVERFTGTAADGSSFNVETLNVCRSAPTAGDRVLGALGTATSWVVVAVVLFLLLRLLERAAEGVHTIATADRLRRFGTFVLIAPPAAALVELVARTVLLSRALDYELHFFGYLRELDVPWWAIVTGVGMLVLAKIIRDGAEMREELEDTV